MTPTATSPRFAGAPSLRFAATFVLCFAVLMGGFEATRGTSFERFVVETLLLHPAVSAIHFLTPGDHVRLIGRVLVSPGGPSLHVTRGCEGIEMFLLLTAAIIATPASAKRRARGLVIGSILAYTLSICRLSVLHYVLRYRPDLWEALHGLVLPLSPVLILALYFLRWSSAGEWTARAA